MKNLKLICLVLVSVLFISACSCSKTKEYTITFDSNGGSSINSQTIKENELIKEPSNPTYEGYTFDGWYLDDAKYDFTSKVTKDLTLKAKWTLKEKVIPDKKEDKVNKTDKVTKPNKTSNEEVKEEVKEEVVIKTYNVTFNNDGVTEVISINENELVKEPSNPVKDKYKFLGWYLNDTKYDFNTKVNEDITLTAKWEYIPTISYLKEDVTDSIVGETYLYVTKDNEKVDGYLDITTTNGDVITKEISKEGYKTNYKIISKVENPSLEGIKKEEVNTSNSLTIKEDSSNFTKDVYLLGYTKLENIIVTLDVYETASINNSKLQSILYNSNDDDLKEYYYSDLTKSWYSISNEEVLPLTKEASILLNDNLYIYYVDNVEKTIEVNFEGVIDNESITPNMESVEGTPIVEENKIIVPSNWIGGFTFTTNNTLVKVYLSEVIETETSKTYKELEEAIIKINPSITLTTDKEVNLNEEATFKVSINPNSYEGVTTNVKKTVTKLNSTKPLLELSNETTISNSEDEIKVTFTENGVYIVKYELTFDNGNTSSASETIVFATNGVAYVDQGNVISEDDIKTTSVNGVLTISGSLDYQTIDNESGYFASVIIVNPYDPRNFVKPIVLIDDEIVTKKEINNNGDYTWAWFWPVSLGKWRYRCYLKFDDKDTTHTITAIYVDNEKSSTEQVLVKLSDDIIFNEKPENISSEETIDTTSTSTD